MIILLGYLAKHDDDFKNPTLIKWHKKNEERAIREGITGEVAEKLNVMTGIWKRPPAKAEYIGTLSDAVKLLNDGVEMTDINKLAYIRAGMLCFAYGELKDDIFTELAQAVTRYQLSHGLQLNVGEDYSIEVGSETRGRKSIEDEECFNMLMTYYGNGNLSHTAKIFDRDIKTIKPYLVRAIGASDYSEVQEIFKTKKGDRWGLIEKAYAIWSKNKK
jgi:hypothetical protein